MAAVVIPGASLLFGLWILFPEAIKGIDLKDVSLGSFGIFALAAFCAGHIIQAPANITVDWYWKRFGRPTEAMRHRGCGLAEAQVRRIPAQVLALLAMDIPADASDDQWRPVTAQMAIYVANSGKAERLDKFNGNYGLFRGLSAALLVLLILALWHLAWTFAALTLLAASATMLRMKRFGNYYARELWLQFLSIDATSTIRAASGSVNHG